MAADELADRKTLLLNVRNGWKADIEEQRAKPLIYNFFVVASPGFRAIPSIAWLDTHPTAARNPHRSYHNTRHKRIGLI